MKKRFVFSILIIVCLNVVAFATNDLNDTIIQSSYSKFITAIDIYRICPTDSSNYCNYSLQSNFVNQNQNKKLELYALIVAVLGIFVGVITTLAITLYNTRKEGIKDLKHYTVQEISNLRNDLIQKIDDYEILKNDIDKKIMLMDSIQHWQDYQNQYTQRINDYLFSITNSVVDSYGISRKDASVIRESLYNQYYAMRVFFPWSEDPAEGTEAAFRYLQVKGTKDNIDDLSFLADNDPDERKRKMAIETIGFIKARLMNGQAS